MAQLRTKVHRHFDNLSEPWRHCEFCGRYEAEQPTDGTIYGGRMYPESELVLHEGKYYCVPHFHFRFDGQFKDDYKLDVKEIDPNPAAT